MAAMSKLQSKTAQAAPASVISLNPDTFTSGGLLDDVDVTITNAAFLMWDYDGTVAVPVPALGVTMRLPGEESDPDPAKDHDQYYSCGKTEDFAPNTEGTGLVPIGTKTGLNNSSNGGLFIASLINIGVPKTLFDSGNIQSIVGIKMHVNRVPAPEGRQARPDGRKPEILVATKLISLPGESGQTGATGNAGSKPGLSKVSKSAAAPVKANPTTASPAASQAGSADAGLDEELVGVVLELVSEAGGTLAKKLIAPKVFARYKGRPEQGAAMKRAASDEFLMGLTEAGFAYDGATLSVAG